MTDNFVKLLSLLIPLGELFGYLSCIITYSLHKFTSFYTYFNKSMKKLRFYHFMISQMDLNMSVRLYSHNNKNNNCNNSTDVFLNANISLTNSSKISLWWTWIVIKVSNFVRSTGDKSFVVWSIKRCNKSRNDSFVSDMAFLLNLAFCSASVESLVHIN